MCGVCFVTLYLFTQLYNVYDNYLLLSSNLQKENYIRLCVPIENIYKNKNYRTLKTQR
jgi:hypothetical protein